DVVPATVTGVQTCALPILARWPCKSSASRSRTAGRESQEARRSLLKRRNTPSPLTSVVGTHSGFPFASGALGGGSPPSGASSGRSEERRVGGAASGGARRT